MDQEQSQRRVTAPAPADAVLKPKEAAAFCRCSTSYLRDSDVPKVLLPPRRGRRPLVRYLKSDLLAWLTRWRQAA